MEVQIQCHNYCTCTSTAIKKELLWCTFALKLYIVAILCDKMYEDLEIFPLIRLIRLYCQVTTLVVFSTVKGLQETENSYIDIWYFPRHQTFHHYITLLLCTSSQKSHYIIVELWTNHFTYVNHHDS